MVTSVVLFPATADTMYEFVPLQASQLRETTFILQFTVGDKLCGTQGSGKKTKMMGMLSSRDIVFSSSADFNDSVIVYAYKILHFMERDMYFRTMGNTVGISSKEKLNLKLSKLFEGLFCIYVEFAMCILIVQNKLLEQTNKIKCYCLKVYITYPCG